MAVAAGGCVMNQPYPENWPLPAIDPNPCLHMNGDYLPDDYASRLAINWIAGKPVSEQAGELPAADKITIRIADGTLRATAYFEGQITAQQESQVQCTGDSVLLDLGRKVALGQGALGYEKTIFRLRKDTASAILINRESSGLGAFGPIPFGGVSSAWIGRLIPYTPNAIIPKRPSQPPRACQYNISQIRVENKEDAEKIERALEQGQSFEQLAAINNQFVLRLQKGSLGWIAPNLFPKWAATILSLRKGEYSRTPIEDEAGWHIIKLNDVRPAACMPPTDG